MKEIVWESGGSCHRAAHNLRVAQNMKLVAKGYYKSLKGLDVPKDWMRIVW